MSNQSLDILPEPPDELKELSRKLLGRIRERIAAQGPIPFSEFMDMALYEPGLGYYSAGLRKFGVAGDFVTAPELGTLFAGCLGRQIAEITGELGACDILEIGAGSGALAVQLLSATRPEMADHPGAYRILERSAVLKALQHETLNARSAEITEGVQWLDEPPRAPWKGIILANEVLDALAVERFQIRGQEVRQVCVDVEGDTLCYTEREAPEELAEAVAALGPLPDGYSSEINPLLPEWIASVTEGLQAGIVLFIDYGYPRSEYYLNQRSSGTMMAHYRHRAHTDLLRYPGLQDLTAWVDFTALAEAGKASGLDVLGYTSQAMFLMGCGLERVVEERRESTPTSAVSFSSEVRQLTLPAMMGERFHVMALGRNWPETRMLSGFSLCDWRHRL